MLAMMVHLNRGTPYIYMGEEIGMLDPNYQGMTDYVDVESQNAYRMLLAKGLTPSEAFAVVQSKARDNSRVPMQWDNSPYAGFSTQQPWLKNGDFDDINVAKDQESEDSLYQFYHQLIQLRQTHPVIADGDYTPRYDDVTEVIAFERRLGDVTLLVVNHFGETPVTLRLLDEVVQTGEYLIGNYPMQPLTNELVLRPYESFPIQY